MQHPYKFHLKVYLVPLNFDRSCLHASKFRGEADVQTRRQLTVRASSCNQEAEA